MIGREVFIYALCHPVTGEPRYIGKALNVTRRVQQHLGDARSRPVYPVHRWIKKLAKDGLAPEVEVVAVTNEKEWQAVERDWIAGIRSVDGNRLLNVAGGGDGTDFYSNARDKRIWDLKKKTGDALKFFRAHGMEVAEGKMIVAMRSAAEAMPQIFGKWARV